ncbi:TVP38/TMEM64 family protein [Aporhodopirellula aestuarii]|uniref:VTT domain-containing protein n=1 Tax=Aporhodopirellula aestuarii TaxID=2950107 RepID=A0ABT0UBT0_9BACT|nr:VTT domain-containing protein [Aporhodopirellula aestuarii]MCM2374373.1 VTT domain-containing protein [Aporhodopirellula aestuarii]
MLKKQSWVKRTITSPTVYVIVLLVVLSVWLLNWMTAMGGPAAVREAYGMRAPLVTIPVHIVVAITPFPSDFISIANGAVYGFYAGAALSWFAWWIAAILEFGLGYRARKDFDLELAIKNAPSWVRRVPVNHPVFLIGARQIPWLGGHLTAFVPGAAGVHLSRFVWCSAIAVIPGSIVMAAIGAGLVGLSQ